MPMGGLYARFVRDSLAVRTCSKQCLNTAERKLFLSKTVDRNATGSDAGRLRSSKTRSGVPVELEMLEVGKFNTCDSIHSKARYWLFNK